MARRHLIIGGGTAGMNAMRTIREEEREPSDITLVSAEKPYSRMVLPYYLDRSIAESHVFTASAALLARWKVKAHLGRRATALDVKANVCTLDDGTKVEYDDCLVATGSAPVRAPVPGADGRNVHSFWTLDECRGVIASITPGSHVVMVGAGFISFTILNSILALGAKLTIVEVAPRILPRMVDDAGAEIVEGWLKAHGVAIRTNVKATKIEDAKGKKRLKFASGADLACDVVIMATGIKTNLDWLKGAGVQINRGIVVNDHLRSNVASIYAAGDVAEGRDLVSGQPAVHAIEPTAQEHGRVVGAWDDAKAEAVSGLKRDRAAYRKLLFTGDRLTGAIIIGRSGDVWTTNDVGMLKGLVQTGIPLGRFKDHLKAHPFDVKTAYIASGTTGALLPETVLGRPSKAPGETPVAV